MSDNQSFSRFSDFPTEIRVQIWEKHFDSYFSQIPRTFTLNGGSLTLNNGRRDPLASLRLTNALGRFSKGMSDRFGLDMSDTSDDPLSSFSSFSSLSLERDTVINSKSHVFGLPQSSSYNGVSDDWPDLKPLINREALAVARACCQRYEKIDLWLDNSTSNVKQPALVDVASDIFRIDPGIAKMILGQNVTPWLARIRRLAIGPFEPFKQCDSMSIMRILEQTQALVEIYILLSPEVISTQMRLDRVRDSDEGRSRFSSMEIGEEGRSTKKLREWRGPFPDIDRFIGEADYAETLRGIVAELGQKYSNAKMMFGYIQEEERTRDTVSAFARFKTDDVSTVFSRMK